MNKKNTVIFSIVAIVALLVMVIGATFAYFTATGAGTDVSVVEVTTSSVDSITSTVGTIELPVTLADMQEANGVNDYTSFKNATGFIEVNINPGTDTSLRTCTYDIVYTPTDVFTNSSTNTINLLELTIKAEGIQDSTNDIGTLSELSLSGINNETNLASDLSFSYDGSALSVIRWNFEVRFYNLALDQSENAGKTFGGLIKIDNIDCNTSSDEPIVPPEDNDDTFTSYLINNHSEANGLVQHTTDKIAGAQDNNYRYSGGNDIVHNYVCFGSDEEVCPEDNLFRVVGIYNIDGENRAKLKKALPLDKDGDGIFEIGAGQHDNFQYDAGNDRRWGGPSELGYTPYHADINLYLNGDYYDAIPVNYQNMIQESKFYNGGVAYSNNSVPKNYFDGEITSQTLASYNIALMYASDFLYAVSEEYWEVVLFISEESPDDMTDNESMKNNNWLYLHDYSGTLYSEWTMTLGTAEDENIWSVFDRNNVMYHYREAEDRYSASPVLFLKNAVKYVSGDGTKSNPFKISI